MNIEDNVTITFWMRALMAAIIMCDGKHTPNEAVTDAFLIMELVEEETKEQNK